MFFLGISFCSVGVLAQSPMQYNTQIKKHAKKPRIVYELNTYDISLLVGGSFLFSYGNNLVRKKTPLQAQDLYLLNKNSINCIDRFATNFWSPSISKVSDLTFLGGLLSTPSLFMDSKIRKEWFTIGFMYLEASVWSFSLTQTTKGLSHRLRPFIYNPSAPLDQKLQTDAKNSFFSGHTALTATYSFLTYKIYSDFYPKSGLKPYLLAGAISLPLLTATGRVLSGKHYLSDVLTGYAVGALVGYGLPFLHRKKDKSQSPSSSIRILIIPF